MTAPRYTVERCRPIGGYPRHYGYTIRDHQPETFVCKFDDLEGIGFIRYKPPYRNKTIHFKGWYKHKSLAVARCRELNS